MTAKEQKMYQNIKEWRNLPKAERRSILHSSAVKQVISSMAMEGEPVSKAWIRKNSR